MTDETLAVARRAMEIVPLVMRTITVELRRGGPALAPGHFRLLGMMAHCPCNLSELARRQGVSLPTMSDSITLLVDRGLAQRIPDPRDRRIVIVELTEAGRSALNEMQSQVESRVAELLAGLSAAQLASLAAGLDVLRQLVDSTYAPDVHFMREGTESAAS
jgi:DNA-binding MarR family transcriptional regulator